MAVISVAVSFLVIILSLAISSGFRREIRDGISSLTGDIQLTSPQANAYGSDVSVNAEPSFLGGILEMKGVEAVTPAVYRAGIVQNGGDLQGVMFKAVPSADTIPLRVGIPRSLARTLRLAEGDELRAYFIGERVQVRKFTVGSIYEGISDNSGNPVVLASIDDLRRVNGWEEDKASALEITLSDRFRSRRAEKDKAVAIAGYAYGGSTDDDDPVMAVAAVDKYYNIFDWLDLIDFNVLAETGSEMAARCAEQGIPMISIDCLYDGAYFFGVDNYGAGTALGEGVCEFVDEKFGGEIEYIVCLWDSQSGDVIKQYSEDAVFSKTLKDYRAHTGCDFGAKEGENVYAMCDGKVKNISVSELYGVIIEVESPGFSVYYCGMSNDMEVEKGDNLTAGDTIGTVGKIPSESADDSHIHVEIRVGKTLIDPLSVINKDE